MKLPKQIFREYDIRGVVGSELTPELAHGIGRAVETLARRKIGRTPRIAVGRDNRPSSGMLAGALRDGIAAASGVAVDVGELPTPALYLALAELDVDGGVQVTGSHNPPEYNGFKMVIGGDTVYGDQVEAIRDLIESGQTDDGAGTQEMDASVLERYQKAILKRNGPLDRPVKVVVDCGNGVMSLAAVETLERLGAEVVPLFCESDGTFPNHHPDPTVPEYITDLQETVRRTGAELGIGFDGDGDRLGVVDEEGTMVFGDRLIVLFGRDLVERIGGGHTVIFDVKCSDVLGADLLAHDLVPEMWKTGHSLLKVRMKERKAPLAGEMSGHIFFGADYYGFDDALFGAARLLQFLSRRREPLSRQLATLPPRASTPEIRIDCPDERKFDLAAHAVKHFSARYDTNTIDGVRIVFEDGWGLLRASNTQPVLVMRFEASSNDALQRNRAEVEEWLNDQGIPT